MPVYNGEKFLAATIESVLKQTYTDFEFLIINDGSSDRSEEIIKQSSDERIRLISHQENQGIYASNMEGIHEAKGEFIALLDHDDICLPDRLELQYNYLITHPDVAICGGNAKYISENGEVLDEVGVALCDVHRLKMKLLFANQLVNPSVMFRKSAFIELEGYHRFGLAEDYDFYLRASERFDIVNLKATLLLYRQHNNNTSLVKMDQMIAGVKSVLKALQQRLGFEAVSEQSVAIHYTFMTGTRNSEFTVNDYRSFLRNFLRIRHIPRHIIKEDIFRRWAEIVTYKGGKSAFFLLFDKTFFHLPGLTWRHFRKALKLSVKTVFRGLFSYKHS